MKFATVVCALVLLACICFQADATCHIHGEDRPVGFHQYKCAMYRCHKDGSVSSKGCSVWACPEGKTIGWKDTEEDKSFPDCCAHPICAE